MCNRWIDFACCHNFSIRLWKCTCSNGVFFHLIITFLLVFNHSSVLWRLLRGEDTYSSVAPRWPSDFDFVVFLSLLMMVIPYPFLLLLSRSYFLYWLIYDFPAHLGIFYLSLSRKFQFKFFSHILTQTRHPPPPLTHSSQSAHIFVSSDINPSYWQDSDCTSRRPCDTAYFMNIEFTWLKLKLTRKTQLDPHFITLLI